MNRLFNVAALSWVAVAMTACDHERPTIEEPPMPAVVAGDVVFPDGAKQVSQFVVNEARESGQPIQHYYGRVVVNEEVTVRVFSPIAGRVEKMMADLGKPVKAGDVLATVLSPDYGQAQADWRKASSDLILAERVLRRVKDLEEHGAAAKKDVEAAQADVDRAMTEKARTEVKLAQYGGTKAELDGTYALRAPIDGVVTDRNINIGQEVRPDAMMATNPQLASPLFIISDPKKLWVMLEVTERDLPKLAPGDELTLHSAAFPDKAFKGKLLKIGDMLDPTTRTAKVRGEIENTEGLLRAEMYVTVDVADGKHAAKGADIAARAVLFRDDKHFVFVEKKSGRFERREVAVTEDHDGQTTVINGVKAGDRVVTDGSLYLQSILDSADNG